MGNMDKKDIEKNISEQKAIIGTRNSNLKCKDCSLRYDDSNIYGNVSRCKAYPKHKPQEVLNGGNCFEYIKEKI